MFSGAELSSSLPVDSPGWLLLDVTGSMGALEPPANRVTD